MENNNKGGRNIIFLGVAATAVTIIMTFISLVIYHNYGDIYLDRSRPGYLPDEEEIEEKENEKQNTYVFSDTGAISDKDLDELLENLNEIVESLDKYTDLFAPQSLSDGVIGIPSE